MSNDDNKVGYKHPPKHTRFKPGQSPNPKGRPKGSKNMATILDEELKKRIDASENGKSIRISKGQAVGKQIVNKSIAGELKAVPILFNEIRRHENQATADAQELEDTISSEDQLTMEGIIQRIRQADSPPASPGDPEQQSEIIDPNLNDGKSP